MKASEVKSFADSFNEPQKKQKRINDMANHIIDMLLDEALASAKRGAYEITYSMEEMDKERIRLSGLSLEEVIPVAIDGMISRGFSVVVNDDESVDVSWK